MTTTTPSRWAAVALAIGALSCSSSSDPAAPPPPTTSPLASSIKVKNLLTGLETTDEEAKTLSESPEALRGLIDQWMETPEFRKKMLDFFKQAFQQTQITVNQFEEMLANKTTNLSPSAKAHIVRSAEMSFPLTAMRLIDEGRPFTEVLTTERYMLNPPLMSLLAYFDNLVVDDQSRVSSWLPRKFGDRFKYTIHYDDSLTIPYEESIDPNSPYFLHFVEPCPVKNGVPACSVIVVDRADRILQGIWNILFGNKSVASGPGRGLLPKDPSLFTEADWEDWRMIRIRRPGAGEDPSLFWDLPSFRGKAPEKQELVLNTARVGFMTTPAFFANWPTNTSNLARATVNQTLIVGLGYSLADSGAIVPVTESGNPDAQHSQPGTACFACHQTLDPMRNFFRQSFSVTYHQQTLPLPPEQQQARFILDDVDVEGTGVGALAAAMARHPRFATAWTQKLCQFANSFSCVEDDPEFLRVASAFRDSNHDFKTLVRELFSSPLVTQATQTKTSDEVGAAVTISRREHFCAALQNRLGLPDACNLTSSEPNLLQNLAFGVPGAGYARGATSPLLPREPNLFFSSSVEGLCGQLAVRVVDPARCPDGQRCFRSAEAEQAMGELVRVVMALPSIDARFEDIRRILKEHYDEATREGHTPTDALRSTFVLACTSPTSSTIGL